MTSLPALPPVAHDRPRSSRSPRFEASVDDVNVARRTWVQRLSGDLDVLNAHAPAWDANIDRCPPHPAHESPDADWSLVHVLAEHPAWNDPAHHATLLAWLDRLVELGESLTAQRYRCENGGCTRSPSRTPLMWAALDGHEALVERLLHHGADVHARSGLMTTLHYATLYGSPTMVQRLIDAGAPPSASSDAVIRSPLHSAVRSSRPCSTTIVDVLLAAGADPNAQDQQGETPLHQAVEDGTPRMVGHLLEGGASMDVPSHTDQTPWDQAQQRAHRWDQPGKLAPRDGSPAGDVRARDRAVLNVMRSFRIARERKALLEQLPVSASNATRVRASRPRL